MLWLASTMRPISTTAPALSRNAVIPAISSGLGGAVPGGGGARMPAPLATAAKMPLASAAACAWNSRSPITSSARIASPRAPCTRVMSAAIDCADATTVPSAPNAPSAASARFTATAASPAGKTMEPTAPGAPMAPPAPIMVSAARIFPPPRPIWPALAPPSVLSCFHASPNAASPMMSYWPSIHPLIDVGSVRWNAPVSSPTRFATLVMPVAAPSAIPATPDASPSTIPTPPIASAWPMVPHRLSGAALSGPLVACRLPWMIAWKSVRRSSSSSSHRMSYALTQVSIQPVAAVDRGNERALSCMRIRSTCGAPCPP